MPVLGTDVCLAFNLYGSLSLNPPESLVSSEVSSIGTVVSTANCHFSFGNETK
jgi:hypothetical protein